jgi:uncharacterized membrane protein YeiH
LEIGAIIYTLTELIAIAAFALSGAMTAIKRGLDLFGVVFIGSVTAIGGGVIRDLLLGSFPPLMFRDYRYLIVSVITSLIAFTAAYFFKEKYTSSEHTVDGINNIVDAVGLGLFTVLGVQTAIGCGYGDNGFFCIFLGVITGIGGGILRDVMTKSTPQVFVRHVYAVASIAGACIYYFLTFYGMGETVSMLVSSVIVFVTRMLATHYKWNFPKA